MQALSLFERIGQIGGGGHVYYRGYEEQKRKREMRSFQIDIFTIAAIFLIMLEYIVCISLRALLLSEFIFAWLHNASLQLVTSCCRSRSVQRIPAYRGK